MTKAFFETSSNTREEIRRSLTAHVETIPDEKIKTVIGQRVKTSYFLKGCIIYYLLQGMGSPLSEKAKIDFASGMEMFTSSLMFLDNLVDHHNERNWQTTYLSEYGDEIHALASHYASLSGLKILFPYLTNYTQVAGDEFELDKVILGMSRMDLQQSNSLEEQIKTIELTNGYYWQIPCSMAASTVTSDPEIIKKAGQMGFDYSVATGIYEEVRDLLGSHGRKRATEVEAGRIIIPFHYAKQNDPSFDLNKYAGRSLSDAEYEELVGVLMNTDALKMTENLIKSYFTKSRNGLKGLVDEPTAATLLQVSIDIEETVSSLMARASSMM